MQRDVVVCMVSDTYADAVRRGFYSTADQTVLSLLSAPQVRRVLVVDHPRGVASQIKRRLGGDGPASRGGKLRGIRPWTVRTEPRLDVRSLRRRYQAVDAQIALACRRNRFVDPVLVTFDLFHAAFGASRWARDTVFYAQDDEREIPRLTERRLLTALAYERVAAGPAMVAAVSSELLHRIRPEGSGLVIPNGVDHDLWAHPVATIPISMSGIDNGHPLVAYAGTIDARLDVSAVAQLSAAGMRVVLAGPVADVATGDALRRLSGVTLLGTLPRSEVVGLLCTADICLLAHVDTPLTRAMSPLKLFEYLASGTPVVATDLPGIREAWANGTLVPPGGDYVAACRHAVAGGPMSEAQRRGIVEEMSWRVRHQPLLDCLTRDEVA